MTQRIVNPKSVWWVVGTLVLTLVILGLRCGLPYCREQQTLALLLRCGGGYGRSPGLRGWLSQRIDPRAEIDALTPVSLVDLSHRPLPSGKIPELLAVLEHLPALQSVHLDGSSVQDSDLALLIRLARLVEVHLSRTGISNAGLARLEGLSHLKDLKLGGTRIDDDGLRLLARFTHLEELTLDDTNITDAGLMHLRGLARLETLVLDHTAVTDAGLQHLKALPSLRYLSLSNTSVSDEGVSALQAVLPQLEVTDD